MKGERDINRDREKQIPGKKELIEEMENKDREKKPR